MVKKFGVYCEYNRFINKVLYLITVIYNQYHYYYYHYYYYYYYYYY